MEVNSRSPAYPPDEIPALRARCLGVPYGAQALFTTRWAFDAAGGYPDVSLTDDVFLALNLRRLACIEVLRSRVYLPDRRWASIGIFRQTLTDWILTAAAASGPRPS